MLSVTDAGKSDGHGKRKQWVTPALRSEIDEGLGVTNPPEPDDSIQTGFISVGRSPGPRGGPGSEGERRAAVDNHRGERRSER
ncbi:hypothetical protein AAFF_G00356390 [Aldrovandia affinis]|uniref:Uncharacterized protein n=1 Tax=Aldrovandia affinis TaxID=143900 RepID=A0AAD7X0B3_9TELE|nr:hypothetical protein AAFF_G00356390 [Aldrovandia affinis]